MIKPYLIKRKIKIVLQNTYQWFLKSYHKAQGRQIVHLLHIGKTGGTAFKAAIENHYTTPAYFILTHRHRVKLWHIPRGEKVIFFVRNPVDRFVSAFYNRKRKEQPLSFYDWSAEEEKAFTRFETPNALALALSSQNDEERKAAENAMHNIGQVKDKISSWFKNHEYFIERIDDILFVGRQETLNSDFESLKSLLQLPDEARLPTDDIVAHRNPEHIDKNLDPRAIETLLDWYKEDYEFIALCEEKTNLKKLETHKEPQENTDKIRNKK